MALLDDTDLEILRLLVEDGRRPYSEIADRVDLSAPAVSDRVSRLQEHGVLRRFTADVDRSQLREGTRVFVHLTVAPSAVDEVREALLDEEAVEHVFTTVASEIHFSATAPRDAVREWLHATVDPDRIRAYDVDLLSEAEWSVTVGATDFALSCAECGNTVTEEGTTARVGGDRKHFCCPSCEERYLDQYEEFREAAGG